MRKFPFIFTAVTLLFAAKLEAAQQKVVRVKPGYATVIVCPVPPELVTVGNSQQFTVQSSGNYVLVKPVVDRGSTNMFIKAGMESYNLVLQVSDTPDLEVRLLPTSTGRNLQPVAPAEKGTKNNDRNPVELSPKSNATPKGKDFEEISPKARSILSSYFKTSRRYTYSVKNSNVILAVDHMVQIEDKLYIICTIVNNSKIPYDIGYVRFKLIDQGRSLLLLKKKLKETELEPIREFYSSSIKPNTSGRLLFVFDKHGFSDKSTIEIKCDEENGRRDLVLAVPGSYVE
ncbi:MAG: DUF4138 domain-containing protein [candidate division KSB1 bacterium]|nr:DUF4138 domain-containing protein [candidate division KSB1 bacterium]MDZ7303232.1 DUF4138 domain-containing protein [candidate division KSB1 bacterium]MDZ7312156.1 DUF4138 domain-containing protein [candidate division KSB1 bacterium]